MHIHIEHNITCIYIYILYIFLMLILALFKKFGVDIPFWSTWMFQPKISSFFNLVQVSRQCLVHTRHADDWNKARA